MSTQGKDESSPIAGAMQKRRPIDVLFDEHLAPSAKVAKTTAAATTTKKTTTAAHVRVCADCQISLPSTDFSRRQLSKGSDAQCRSCITSQQERRQNRLYKCSTCQRDLPSTEFTKSQQYMGKTSSKQDCRSCFLARTEKQKPEKPQKFGTPQKQLALTETKGSESQCQACIPKKKQQTQEAIKVVRVTCAICRQSLSSSSFGRKQKKMGDGVAKCKSCLQAEMEENRKRREQKEEEIAQSRQRRLEEQAREMAEKERILTLPRKCSLCGEFKRQECYSRMQWGSHDWRYINTEEDLSKLDQKCLDCFPLDQEEALERQRCREANERRRKEEKKKLLASLREGTVFYRFPRNDELVSVQCYMSKNDMVGEYDMIYYIAWHDGDITSRTLKGTVSMRMQKNRLYGDVKFKNALTNSWSEADFTMAPRGEFHDSPYGRVYADEDSKEGEEKEKDHDGRDEIILDAKFVNIQEDFQEESDGLMLASLFTLSQRVACPWVPIECAGSEEEEYDDDDSEKSSDDNNDDDNDYQAVKLEYIQLDKADALVRDYLQGTDYSKSWLCQHLNLNKETAALVHEYVAQKPPCPVFMFEPGDLFVRLDMEAGMHEPAFGSYVVARKRHRAD